MRERKREGEKKVQSKVVCIHIEFQKHNYVHEYHT